MQDNKIDILANAKPRKAILTLALPTLLASIIQLIYNITDTFFIGQLNDSNQLAAISYAFPIFMVLQGLSNIFAIGAPSVISRKLGENREDVARKVSATALYASLILGVITTVVFFIFQNQTIKMSGATTEPVFTYTKEYLTVIFICSAVILANVTLAGLLRSKGDTTKSTIGIVIGAIVNIILDPIMISSMNMGAKGAAIATVIGNFVSVVFFVICLLKTKYAISLSPKDVRFSKEIFGSTLALGVPACISMVVMSFSNVLFNNLAGSYGDKVVAAFGVTSKMFSMVVMLSLGFAQGYQPFAGFNYGAGNLKRLKEGMMFTILCGTSLCVLINILFIFAPEFMMKIFSKDVEVIDIGIKMLHAEAWCVSIFALQMTLQTTYQAMGKALIAMIIALSRQCIIFIPLMYILNNIWGFDGLIYAQSIADILTTVVAVIAAIFIFGKLNKIAVKNGGRLPVANFGVDKLSMSNDMTNESLSDSVAIDSTAEFNAKLNTLQDSSQKYEE